ncbi:MAG: UDP-N-acetylmuramoyl-tripeptide--D-alanyl-D-alanine ligase [Oscillospiraceae bacterium]
MKMKPLSLADIARCTGGTYVGPADKKNKQITGVVRDNRDVQEGNLFLCIRGARVDGHDFAASAIEAGAAANLSERPLSPAAEPYILVSDTLAALRALAEYYRSLFSIPVIGITGSVGKTSAKEMIAAVLSKKYSVLKTAENLNNEIGVPLTLLSLREEHEAAVVEMGISDFGEMSRLAEMARPTVCVMTTIGYCHLETLGDLAGVLRAKSEVFRYMSPDSFAVMNGDDELLKGFNPGTRKVTFGFGDNCDIRAQNLKNEGLDGTSFSICEGSHAFPAFIPAFGAHLVSAALSAAAVGRLLGLSEDDIRTGILDYAPVGGRSNVQKTGYITIINDCYNANPNSVTAAILSLASLSGRRVAILGDMMELGHDSRELHREMGVLIGRKNIDSLICCGNMAEFYYKGLISCGDRNEAWHFPMKEALYSVLPSLIRKGDTVLVKASHGMHFEEIVEELKRLK